MSNSIQQTDRAPRPALARTTQIVLLTLAGLCCTGCVRLQETHYYLLSSYRAHVAWQHKNCCFRGIVPRKDFGCGWRAGYVATATGQCDGLPVVPPPCYWSPKYRSAQGVNAVQSWFDGYQHGCIAAEQAGYGNFNMLPSTAEPSCDPVYGTKMFADPPIATVTDEDYSNGEQILKPSRD